MHCQYRLHHVLLSAGGGTGILSVCEASPSVIENAYGDSRRGNRIYPGSVCGFAVCISLQLRLCHVACTWRFQNTTLLSDYYVSAQCGFGYSLCIHFPYGCIWCRTGYRHCTVYLRSSMPHIRLEKKSLLQTGKS